MSKIVLPDMQMTVLYLVAVLMLSQAVTSLAAGDIWKFLSGFGTMLQIVTGPAHSEFYNKKLNKLSDLHEIYFVTDPISAAFFRVALIMVVVGLAGMVLA